MTVGDSSLVSPFCSSEQAGGRPERGWFVPFLPSLGADGGAAALGNAPNSRGAQTF